LVEIVSLPRHSSNSCYEMWMAVIHNITYSFIHTALVRTQGCVQNAWRLSITGPQILERHCTILSRCIWSLSRKWCKIVTIA